MPGDYKRTHQRILESAEARFLEKGYERANLREICRGAGVTVGAFYNHFKDKHALFGELVEPCIEGIHQRYETSAEEIYAQLSTDNLFKAWDISSRTILDFIEFIYENLAGFRLLLLCSDGTEFSDFVEDLVKIEVDGFYIFCEEMKERNVQINRPPHSVIHMLSHTYFAAVFDCVVHDYEKEDALKGVDSFIVFYNAGWKKLLGIE